MRALADEALEAGAIGVSTGLYLRAGVRRADRGGDRGRAGRSRRTAASTCTHMRDEGDT